MKMRQSSGKTAQLIKMHNRTLVLRIIQQQQTISRKDIAILTGLTQATITRITQYLLEHGLIVELEEEEYGSNGSYGRKPIALAINQQRYKVISVYIGRQYLQSAVADLAGNLICKQELYKQLLGQGNEVLLQEIISSIKDVIKMGNVDPRNVLGIGISAPGPINAQKGILLGRQERSLGTAPQYSVPFDWRELPLTEAIQQEFGVKAFADNCVNVSALAENWFGNGIGVSNFVLYSIGPGVGAGAIIDGMLYRGEDDVVAEIGHITVDVHGPRCICGNIGCLELYTSFAHILEEYQEMRQNEKPDNISKEAFMSGTFPSNVAKLFQMADQGDQIARQLLKRRAEMLGIGAVSLANIFNPEYIILAPNEMGDVDLSLIVEELQNCVRNRAFSVIADKVQVIQSKLKNDIHLYGGVALVLQDFFQTLPKKV